MKAVGSIPFTAGVGAILLAVASFVVRPHTGHTVSAGYWAGAAGFAAVALFMRYLKIFRLFHEEIFTTYAALDPPQPAAP